MSEDIVERLRSWRHDSWPSDPSFDAAAEIERLRARVEVLECALRDARHNGLIYWEPQTTRGAVERAAMMARIDIVLNLEAQP
jgi:hypothetical protein